MYEIIYRKRGKVIAFPVYRIIIAQIPYSVKEHPNAPDKRKTAFLPACLAKGGFRCYTYCMDMNTRDNQCANAYSSAQLAYLGDAVLEVMVRRQLVLSHAPHPSETALAYVTAAAQSDAVERILPCLSEEEEAVYRRARNSVHANVPKRATVAQYRRATGLEALFAYLHLTNDTQRLEELFRLAYPDLTQPET